MSEKEAREGRRRGWGRRGGEEECTQERERGRKEGNGIKGKRKRSELWRWPEKKCESEGREDEERHFSWNVQMDYNYSNDFPRKRIR